MRKSIFTLVNIILITLPLFIFFIILIYAKSRILHILPSGESYTPGYRSYSNEQTIIDLFEAAPEMITMEFTLNGDDPYAGICLQLAAEFPLLDLTGYAALHLEITAEEHPSLGIIIKTFEPGITGRKENGFIHLRQQKTFIELEKTHNIIKIPLANFKDPKWWLDEYSVRQGLERNPLRYAYVLQIVFNAINPGSHGNRVILEKVSFHLFTTRFWYFFIILICGYYALFGTILVIRRLSGNNQGNNKKLLSSYKKIAKESYREKDAERMICFINNNYNDPVISLDSIVEATGLSRKRITALCQQEHNMTLKEYINWLRLTEAQRLLLESDLTITEIAFALGYSSSSYFGVLFKNMKGVSPKEFRKKSRHISGE